MKYYYHATTQHSLQNILTYGLLPQERTGDSPFGERITHRTYLLDDPEEVEWYAHNGVILKVRIPPGVKVKQSAYVEGYYVTKPIPPKYIEVYKDRQNNNTTRP